MIFCRVYRSLIISNAAIDDMKIGILYPIDVKESNIQLDFLIKLLVDKT